MEGSDGLCVEGSEGFSKLMKAGAEISGKYRYNLWRIWDRDDPIQVWVMLNPSTANATEDDPTIRRCMGFAKAFGCGGIRVANLFAFRATSPKDLKAARDPIGLMNNIYLSEICKNNTVICAWGAHGGYLKRDEEAMGFMGLAGARFVRLGDTTKDGHPRHPLYVKGDVPLVGHYLDER